MLDDIEKKFRREECYLQKNSWQEDKSALVILIFKETKFSNSQDTLGY